MKINEFFILFLNIMMIIIEIKILIMIFFDEICIEKKNVFRVFYMCLVFL